MNEIITNIICKKENNQDNSVHKNTYIFKTDNYHIILYQAGNLDIYFAVCSRVETESNIHKFSVNEFDLEKNIISAIDKLYNNISVENKNEVLVVSDERNADKDEDFNTLKLVKQNLGYDFEFTNNTENQMFSIALNTNRGHNRKISLEFLTLLQDLGKCFESEKER